MLKYRKKNVINQFEMYADHLRFIGGFGFATPVLDSLAQSGIYVLLFLCLFWLLSIILMIYLQIIIYVNIFCKFYLIYKLESVISLSIYLASRWPTHLRDMFS